MLRRDVMGILRWAASIDAPAGSDRSRVREKRFAVIDMGDVNARLLSKLVKLNLNCSSCFSC